MIHALALAAAFGARRENALPQIRTPYRAAVDSRTGGGTRPLSALTDAYIPAFHRLPPVRAAKGAGAYVALGDSISNSPDTAGGPVWPALLSRTLPSLPYLNLALPGVTSAYVRTTELAAVPSGCALVTLEAGANDFEREPWVDFQTFGTQLRATLDVLHFERCPAARIVVLTYVNDYPPDDPRHAAFERLNAYTRGLPRTRPWVTVVDLDADARFHPFPGSPLMWNAIHENGAGQYVIAADVAAAL